MARTMFKVQLLPALAVLATLSGCLEVELDLTIAADGSGTQRMHLGMNDELIRSVRASARALSAGVADPQDPLAVYDKAAVTAELEAQGLSVESHTTTRERGREFVDVTASFKSLDGLRSSTLYGAEGEWFVLAGRNEGGVRLVYYPRGHSAWLASKERAVALRAAPTVVQQQFFAKQKLRVAGLDIALKLTLPGDVDYCSTNMEKTTARAVAAGVRADKIRNAADLVLALAPRFEVEFDGAGCAFELDRSDPGMAALRAKRAAAEASSGR